MNPTKTAFAIALSLWFLQQRRKVRFHVDSAHMRNGHQGKTTRQIRRQLEDHLVICPDCTRSYLAACPVPTDAE